MCLSLYDYQSKASRYSYGLTYLKTRVTTNQKHIIDSQKPKTKELEHNTKENISTSTLFFILKTNKQKNELC